MSAKAIGTRLGLARGTILEYRQRAAEKLGVPRALRAIEGRRSSLRLSIN